MWISKNIILGVSALTMCAGLYTACKTVAVTGRKQLSLVPESEMVSMSTQQYDKDCS
jgi:uncharacterized protein YycO